MKVEVPEFKRCCCCIPLRYGILFWVYVKLIVALLFLGTASFTVIDTAITIQRSSLSEESFNREIPSYYIRDIALLAFAILIALLEISMDIMFIVGGHKKNPRLMKVFYYYNIVLLCLYILCFIVIFTLESIHESLRPSASIRRMTFYLKLKIGGLVVNLVVQLYLILLIRSEVRKLQSQTTFHFKNNAAEAECNMGIQDGNIETRSDENSDEMAKITNEMADGIKNNNINREEDEKLKLNKYQVIRNVDVE